MFTATYKYQPQFKVPSIQRSNSQGLIQKSIITCQWARLSKCMPSFKTSSNFSINAVAISDVLFTPTFLELWRLRFLPLLLVDTKPTREPSIRHSSAKRHSADDGLGQSESSKAEWGSKRPTAPFVCPTTSHKYAGSSAPEKDPAGDPWNRGRVNSKTNSNRQTANHNNKDGQI
jgi:hypothetical protein